MESRSPPSAYVPQRPDLQKRTSADPCETPEGPTDQKVRGSSPFGRASRTQQRAILVRSVNRYAGLHAGDRCHTGGHRQLARRFHASCGGVAPLALQLPFRPIERDEPAIEGLALVRDLRAVLVRP